jgi:hypothetical protein
MSIPSAKTISFAINIPNRSTHKHALSGIRIMLKLVEGFAELIFEALRNQSML